MCSDTEKRIRKANEKDMPRILEIYEEARRFMAENGNPGQWTDGYPKEELIREDMARGNLYLCEEGDGIAAVFVFFLDEEPSYRNISGGAWLNEEPYGTIHRIASAGKRKGAASFCVDWCYKQCRNLRIDTYKDNLPMQRFLKKKGFLFCGAVQVENTKGDRERLAFQKCENKR